MRAAPELLGAPTIGGGSAQPGVGGGGSPRSQISLPCHPKYTKTAKKRAVSHTFWLKNPPKCRFSFKSTLKDMYIPDTFFEEYINFKIFHYFKPWWSYTIQSLGSHIRPQPPGLGLMDFLVCSVRLK